MKNTIMTMLGFIGVCIVFMLVVAGSMLGLRFMSFILNSIEGIEIGVISVICTFVFVTGSVIGWVVEEKKKANLI